MDQDADGDIRDYAMSVDEVEEITGIDFFTDLHYRTERRVESSYDLQDWFFPVLDE